MATNLFSHFVQVNVQWYDKACYENLDQSKRHAQYDVMVLAEMSY